jgi:hypothetical protein
MRTLVPQLLVLGYLLGAAACVTLAPDAGETAAMEDAASDDEAGILVADAEEESGPESGEVPEAVAEEGGEKEVPLAVAKSEQREPHGPIDELAAVTVQAERHDVIHSLVAQAQAQLRDVPLQYVFTGKGKQETLRGRPVAFALWSESKMQWTIAHVEIPRPPVKWKPGRKPLPFLITTPGIVAQHVKGTGAERLMFAFSKDGEPLKVYGRKFPVFDNDLVKKKRWRDAVATARPIVYLPFTEDTFDSQFVSNGKGYLLATAQRAIQDLRLAGAPSKAFPGESLADVVPPEVITTLAVIEQTDDADFVEKGEGAFDEVLSQYGLKQGEAYRYSVSSAAAIGPMQFTNKRGNGTYALVVRRCPEARLDRDFERGATDLLNAMKAAICLFDVELAQMPRDVRTAYHDNMKVLGIFPVAAYNGGPKNVKKLQKVMKKAGVKLEELRAAGETPEDSKVKCPCLWKEVADEIRPVALPKYNNENRWYIEKYQRILSVFDEEPILSASGL